MNSSSKHYNAGFYFLYQNPGFQWMKQLQYDSRLSSYFDQLDAIHDFAAAQSGLLLAGHLLLHYKILPQDSFIAMHRDEYAIFKSAMRHQSYVDFWLQQSKLLILNVLRLCCV